MSRLESSLDESVFGTGARAPIRAAALPIVCVSSIAILASLVLGVAQVACRKRRPGHANVSWYLLGPALLSLALSHVASLVVGIAFVHDPRVAGNDTMRFHGPMLCTWFTGLYAVCVLGAAKCAFWEVTARRELRAPDHWRWVTLAFDALLFFLIAGSLFATTFDHNLCADFADSWSMHCFPNAVDNVLASMVNPQLSRGLMIFIFLEYLNVLLSSLAAGQGARRSGCDSPVADAMVFVVSPLLAMQMFAGIPVMALGMHVDFEAKAFVYYASLPYWIIQFLVLGALMWAFRTRPLWIDGPEGELKLQMSPTEESLAYYSAQPYAPHQMFPRPRVAPPHLDSSAPRPRRPSLRLSAPPTYVSEAFLPRTQSSSPAPHASPPPSSLHQSPLQPDPPRADSPDPVPLRPYSPQSAPLLFMPVLPAPQASRLGTRNWVSHRRRASGRSPYSPENVCIDIDVYL